MAPEFKHGVEIQQWLEKVIPLQQPRETEWNDLHRNPPKFLYHYTNARGLQGIVQTQQLWASNALFLNDSTELVYAGGLIRDTLESLGEEFRGQAARLFIARGRESLSLAEMGSVFEIYVSCFCENGDLLSQWRGYPPAGGGYAVGFASSQLGRHAPEQIFLRRVIYAVDKQRDLVRQVFQPVLEALESLEDERGQEVALAGVPGALTRTRWLLYEFAFGFKHPSFAEETEWRLVHIRLSGDDPAPRSPIHCRATATGFVPYVELPVHDQAGVFNGRLPIEEVVVGPAAHHELARRAATTMLSTAGYRSPVTTVRNSDIPLRV